MRADVARDAGSAPCPIVGLGASAGGLEAMVQFFEGVPEKCGLAFVVVQHLDPTHKDMLAELLQRATRLTVMQARDRTRVEPNRVYVIPPNADLSVLHGVLHVLAPTAPRGQRSPIDHFFRALADDRREQAIGVLLSGMGSDGTQGLRLIKARGGITFAQDPAQAKFDAMPRSALDAGVVDVSGPAEELAGRIARFLAHAPLASSAEPVLASKTRGAIEKICLLLRDQTGADFSQYKRSTVYRRIERRMGLHQLDSIGAYVKLLQQNPQETQLLFKELLIGVTSFFRDPAAWEHLKKEALPRLLAERGSGGTLRAWVPGCSTGEEAYSLAITLKEVLEHLKPARSVSVQIFATDLDGDAIGKARQGVYPAAIAADVSPERLRRYFVEEEHAYRVRPEIREAVIFAQQNVLQDPPFTRLDVLSCRNLLIYLSPELQKTILPLFHYSLVPGGVLFLGSAETVGAATELFAPLDAKSRTYRRLESTPHPEPVEFPSAFRAQRPATEVAPTPRAVPPALPALADRLLLDRYAPAAVITTAQGDIVYLSGHTGKYLEPASGKANWNVHVMARDGLRHELTDAFQKAARERRAVVRTGAHVKVNGALHGVDLTVEPLQEPEKLRGLVAVVFSDVPAARAAPPGARGKRGGVPVPVNHLELELRQARQELRVTREEMQTSQEELKSANEELQSTNEELQSTNEELTTSKEEMQSLNEELQTLNQELQGKVDELSRTSDDMRNLLDSTDIATLLLDDGLNVRRFTSQVAKIIKLIPGDVNRPITDLASDLLYPDLANDTRAVLRSLVPKEAQVATVDGRWFTVRIMPYRTLDNRIDGAVITFVDVTAARKLEQALREQQARAERPR